MSDQQYLASRDRATEVRQYLESRFQLHSKLVGVMPLGARPLVLANTSGMAYV